ncbi:CLUMA_CG001840, isoform A [Clunio marinus]|uniref:CLUMA_CG001840, isoform A n=1 Tax=Clunio marinus TaxID=568069 RepID=A0A1J1HJ58_9DIPT|nr:CLUMA_CG001840, isoform A [Clunio marinus]
MNLNKRFFLHYFDDSIDFGGKGKKEPQHEHSRWLFHFLLCDVCGELLRIVPLSTIEGTKH